MSWDPVGIWWCWGALIKEKVQLTGWWGFPAAWDQGQLTQAQILPLAQQWLVQGWPGPQWTYRQTAYTCPRTCTLRCFTKGCPAFAAAASPHILSHPTARRKLPLHPSFPSPSPAQPFFHCCPGFFHPIFFLWPPFPFPPPSFSLACHTHTQSHTVNPPRAADLPADLECGGAEGCPVTSCPSTSPLPYSPLIYCKGQVTSARKTDATITFPFSAALSPCFFLMETVGKKNLLLLSKSYQIFIRVIL